MEICNLVNANFGNEAETPFCLDLVDPQFFFVDVAGDAVEERRQEEIRY